MKLRNLLNYFPEARQDIKKVLVNSIKTDAAMMFYHSVAKVSFEIAFDCILTRVR